MFEPTIKTNVNAHNVKTTIAYVILQHVPWKITLGLKYVVLNEVIDS